ncbi:MAG: hypothetical protein PHD74_09515, partial [Candidatus Krumholzibacteria bacterium]|nr:hypothetical protein [Candidatus Krumholzibacteria bacterium]
MNAIWKMLVAMALVICAALPCAGTGGAAWENAAPGAPTSGTAVDIANLLPAASEIPGWKIDEEPLVYTADNLWEYIDGSADNFLSYGFLRLIAQDYVSAAGKGLAVEIYEHETSLMAYGIYAQMRSPGLQLREIGDEAFSDAYSMSFRKGNFFVRIAVFESADELREALERFAVAIAAKIPEGEALPAEVDVFPEEGLVPNDTRYITQGVLAREGFPSAFVGTYGLAGGEAKLYLSTLADGAAARDTLNWYLSRVTSFQEM